MYIKEESNVVAGALLRLPISKSGIEDKGIFLNFRVFEDTVTFLLEFQKIKEIQNNDTTLKK